MIIFDWLPPSRINYNPQMDVDGTTFERVKTSYEALRTYRMSFGWNDILEIIKKHLELILLDK